MGFGGAKSNPLLDFQLATNLLAGQDQYRAAQSEANLLREQSSILADEYERDARRKQREVGLFREEQAQKYLAGGVLLDGSPLAVIEETRLIGEQEVAAIRKSGAARARLLRSQADQVERGGLTSLLTKQAENTYTKMRAEQEERARKAEQRRSLVTGAFRIGSALLKGY